jgi:hypothetical protein
MATKTKTPVAPVITKMAVSQSNAASIMKTAITSGIKPTTRKGGFWYTAEQIASYWASQNKSIFLGWLHRGLQDPSNSKSIQFKTVEMNGKDQVIYRLIPTRR